MTRIARDYLSPLLIIVATLGLSCGGGEHPAVDETTRTGFDRSAFFDHRFDSWKSAGEWIFEGSSGAATIAGVAGPALQIVAPSVFAADRVLGIECGFLSFDGTAQHCAALSISPEEKRALSGGANGFAVQLLAQFRSMGPIAGSMTVTDQEYGKGWLLEVAKDGRLRLTLNPLSPEPYQVMSTDPVENGRWHRVVVEVSRIEKRAAIMMDGVDKTGAIRGEFPSESIEGDGEFSIGGYRNAHLRAEIAYLRIVVKGSF